MDNYLDFNTASPQDAIFHQNIDVNDIKHNALNRLPDILQHLFPQGKFSKDKFTVGNVDGESGKSLVVETAGDRIGCWHDFATKEGGDIFTLWARAKGLSTDKQQFAELLQSLAAYLNKTPVISIEQPTGKKQAKTPPMDALGHHAGKWDYYDADGKLILCMYRYDTDKGKVYRPWDPEIRKHKAPNPRPLYNQPGIKQDDHVILVEGEKCAEALIKQGITATTAMNGANASVDKTDWSPLQNKYVLIWPDNDKAGRDYANAVSEYLSTKGIPASISLLNVPDDKPEKWDVADAVDDKLDINSFLAINAVKVELESHVDSDQIIKIDPTFWQGSPPQREWLIENWLPRGYVSALYGDGGIGKSLLAQQLMTCVATGKPWLGLRTTARRVYGLMCEDDANELWRRQYSINKALQVNMHDLNNMCFVSRVGFNNLLMTFDGKDSGRLTDFFNALLEDLIDFSADLVVLDTAADLFGGNEINRSQVRQFVQNACAKIARQTNSAVLLCAHPSDSGIQRKTGTGGSTAWNNTVRSRWYLTRPSEEDADPNERILSRKKSNYAANGSDLHLRWDQSVFIRFTPDPHTKQYAGKKIGIRHELERKRKKDAILELIANEALKGNVYLATPFADKFEDELKLGSASTIVRRLKNYATKGWIKYRRDAEVYGLQKPPASQGYLCVQGMRF